MTSTLTKHADIGGQGGDANFESSFSGLAHAFMREKAPMLEPYELGFQLLERSDDGERAVGITGFQVGRQLMYAPVFWLNGQIKGSELLFAHSTSMFVPCKENWVNYLLGRRTQQIGTGVSRNPRMLGIRQPDLKRMTRSPYKFAAERTETQVPNWVLDAEESLCKVAVQSVEPTIDLMGFIEACGPNGVRAFHKLAEVSPETALAVHRQYGDKLLEALHKAAKAAPAESPDTGNADNSTDSGSSGDIVDPKAQSGMKLRVFTLDTSDELPADTSDADREALLRDGFMVHDLREDDEASKAYAETGPARVFNPSETGLYDVITKLDGIAKCLVISKPWGPDGREGSCLVVKLDGDSRSSLFARQVDIWATKYYDASEYQEFVSKLKNADDVVDNGGRMLLLDSRGHGSVPMTIDRMSGDENGGVSYVVRPEKSYVCGVVRDTKRGPGQPSYGTSQIVVDNDTRTKFRASEGKLYVPSTATVLNLRDRYSEEFMLGRASDLKNTLYRSLSKLAVFRNGSEVVLSYRDTQTSPMSATEAAINLISRVGLRESAARELLKTAAAHRVARCMVKVAEPYLDNEPAYALPSDLDTQHQGSMQLLDGDSVPTTEFEPQNQPVGMPKEYVRQPIRPVHYVDDGAFDTARQAEQSGAKDVFDASVMTSMLRNMRDDQLIDRFVPSLASALDATGRLLFQFYWHQEDFAERYGDRDMPELEDGLRNLFEALGDMTLKLKQKSVDPYPEDTDGGVDLTDIAGAS